MSGRLANPSESIRAVFQDIDRGPMADLPLRNPRLHVATVGFRLREQGHWCGILITPWAINLLCLPDGVSAWPASAAGERCTWSFPSGDYDFLAAEHTRIGKYHLCSIFSPATQFDSHDEASLLASAMMDQLFVPAATAAGRASAPADPSRRRLLGLGA